MKHPAAQQPARPGIPSNIPWSAEGELNLRENIKIYWGSMWISIGAFLMLSAIGAADHNPVPVAISPFFFVLAMCLLYKLNHAQLKLGREMGRGANGEFFEGSGMLANKPRDTSRLTRWIQHPPHPSYQDGDGIHLCECGLAFELRAMAWIENATTEAGVDPYGGRYVLICQCGIGHYRLKG